MNEKQIIRLREIVSEKNWIFAETYAKTSPHWYILRRETDDDDFEWLVTLIREYGVEEYYLGEKYTYLHFEGYKYWTMGAPLKETTVLNRAEVQDDKKVMEIHKDST